MARKRDYRAEYRRRQQLARQRGFSSYYAQRIESARKAHPNISRAAAAGHRSASDLIHAIQTAPGGTLISFLGLDRQADGTWRRASFVLLTPDEGEREFILGPRQLGRLPEIADLLGTKGVPTLGADYMQSMVEWVEDSRPDFDDFQAA